MKSAKRSVKHEKKRERERDNRHNKSLFALDTEELQTRNNNSASRQIDRRGAYYMTV